MTSRELLTSNLPLCNATTAWFVVVVQDSIIATSCLTTIYLADACSDFFPRSLKEAQSCLPLTRLHCLHNFPLTIAKLFKDAFLS